MTRANPFYRSRQSIKLATAAIIFLTLIALVFFTKFIMAEDHVQVTAKAANVRSGPGNQHGVLGQVRKDEILPVLKRVQRWLRVRLPSQTKGWISTSVVKAVRKFTCGTSTVDDADGNTYHTVLIGGQCWMSENMRTTKYPGGTSITKGPVPHGASGWHTDQSYYSCPPNTDSNGEDCAASGGAEKLGMLYQWSAAMNGSTTPGDQGICPSGWHVPTDAEFTILVNGQGTLAGDKLKKAGFCQGRDFCGDSGFDALLAGVRYYDGHFYGRTDAYLWSSSFSDDGLSRYDEAWYQKLNVSNVQVVRGTYYTQVGYSVRCLKSTIGNDSKIQIGKKEESHGTIRELGKGEDAAINMVKNWRVKSTTAEMLNEHYSYRYTTDTTIEKELSRVRVLAKELAADKKLKGVVGRMEYSDPEWSAAKLADNVYEVTCLRTVTKVDIDPGVKRSSCGKFKVWSKEKKIVALDDTGLTLLDIEKATNKIKKETSEAFLAKAAKKKGAQASESGLIYTRITEGTGGSPSAGDFVKVHYHGTLIDGTVFDSSVERGQPASFPLNRVIPCWTEGVQKMKVGEKAELICPSSIAYGDRGSPPRIPGGATLIFEVELLEIVKK